MGLTLEDCIMSINETAWVKVVDYETKIDIITKKPVNPRNGFMMCWKFKELLDNDNWLALHNVIRIDPTLTYGHEVAIMVFID